MVVGPLGGYESMYESYRVNKIRKNSQNHFCMEVNVLFLSLIFFFVIDVVVIVVVIVVVVVVTAVVVVVVVVVG